MEIVADIFPLIIVEPIEFYHLNEETIIKANHKAMLLFRLQAEIKQKLSVYFQIPAHKLREQPVNIHKLIHSASAFSKF